VRVKPGLGSFRDVARPGALQNLRSREDKMRRSPEFTGRIVPQ